MYIMYLYLSLSLSLYIYIYICVYMYKYVYIYMYTHIHTLIDIARQGRLAAARYIINMRPIPLLRLSLLRFVDPKLPGKSLWT